MSRNVFLVAGEASGDALGADLIEVLRRRDASLTFSGVGGSAMEAAGVTSAVDISGLGVLGFIDGLLVYQRVVRAVAATVQAAEVAKPDVAVLVDSWGFTIRVAQALKAARPDLPIVKYVGPQVWATRPGRAETLARSVDHLICIHDFEPAYYAPFGLPCTVCGHPAIGRFKPGDASAFRVRHGIGEGARIVLVLPGSRSAEIRRCGPVLWGAAEMLAKTRPDICLAMVAAGSVAEAARRQALGGVLIVDESEKGDAFAAAHVALAASGTVTTEVALQGAPVVVGYRLGWITWALARAFLFKAKFASLMNVAADAEVAPEFIQTRFTPANLAAAAGRLLDDAGARAAQIGAQHAALDKMGRGGRPAADIAAEAVLAAMGAAKAG